MIQDVLRQYTDMSVEQPYVDSQSQSEIAFGLCPLLLIDLLPRLRPIHSQKVYLPDSSHTDRYLQIKAVLIRPINGALIQQQYDDLVKYASVLQSGVRMDVSTQTAMFHEELEEPCIRATWASFAMAR
ncbi:MAG: Tn3 family transposase [Chloroflexi bacterium AL-W]|nr:Tn3 family transposase [Chloroflexi bacterium AL-N1]NOK67244.1 Tn3 family transposase [Chloroflexi bacterium AL-N10]NOK75262.1 Tn3 family transposase [Chloroflexi bacterium AL-N5]NOK82050.1 Tn3 family transposase [Chloroflexi bacterium AL-W]NOK89895.1 Tn3 family transposase [Chloroflexi bacterium AL-N15]